MSVDINKLTPGTKVKLKELGCVCPACRKYSGCIVTVKEMDCNGDVIFHEPEFSNGEKVSFRTDFIASIINLVPDELFEL